jgi:hypothetical protein
MAADITPVALGGEARHPRAVAMLVCERIIRDARTDQVSLIDLVDQIAAPAFPLVVPSVAVYARLTEALGSYLFTLDVVRRDDILEVTRYDVRPFEATDPLDDGEVIVHQLGLVLPSAGSYDVRLWANGRFVHSVSIRAGV